MSGYLTAADIRRATDELWHKSRPRRLASADEAAERASDAVGIWAAAHPRLCGAVLFPLPRDLLTDVVIWVGEPVHPDVAARCGRVQGPAPATCAREPHPDSPWHWNEGTWWR